MANSNIKNTVKSFFDVTKAYDTSITIREYVNSIGLVKTILKYTQGTAFSKYGFEKGNLLNYNLSRNFDGGDKSLIGNVDLNLNDDFYSPQDVLSIDKSIGKPFLEKRPVGSVASIEDFPSGNNLKKKISAVGIAGFSEKIKERLGISERNEYYLTNISNDYNKYIDINHLIYKPIKIGYNEKKYNSDRLVITEDYAEKYLGELIKKSKEKVDKTIFKFANPPKFVNDIEDYHAPDDNTDSYIKPEDSLITGGGDNDIIYSQYQEPDGKDAFIGSSNGKINYVKDIESKSIIDNVNSLFIEHKIQTLVNRFHGDKDGYKNDDLVTSYSKYGISKGRNLLKKSAESGDNNKKDNGYDNPYCRVWTSHHQYNKLHRRIRPFYDGDNAVGIEDTQRSYGLLRPHGSDLLSTNTVLDRQGFVRMNPSNDYRSIKNCMFSIENLAWRDIDIKRQLSEEQQGPNGGRIMWFPPYNLKFSENVSVEWNSNKFIGRGEQIYTYTNTDRSGTISFTLLIDHPSIINEYRGKSSAENDILRFFAGCGNLDGEQDEGITYDAFNGQQKANDPDINARPDDDGIYAGIAVFFPNNFTGYDFKGDEMGFTFSDTLFNIDYEGSSNEVQGDGFKSGKDTNLDILNQEAVYSNTGVNYSYYHLNSFDNETIGKNNVKPYDEVKKIFNIKDNNIKIFDFFSGIYGCSYSSGEKLKDFLIEKINNGYKIEKISIQGCASTHGNVDIKNYELCDRRRDFLTRVLKKYISEEVLCKIDDSAWVSENNKIIMAEENTNHTIAINQLDAKLGRRATALFKLVKTDEVPSDASAEDGTYTVSEDSNVDGQNGGDNYIDTISYSRIEENPDGFRYDNEYKYFESVRGDDAVYKKITEKIKYFDPAYHSITPEGFNARLTFLHQCTRQGPTIELSSGRIDEKSNSYLKYAGNLAFGRPPYCILRIGDFFHTKICITSMSIDYDNGGGIGWDLNQEGIGVQPMFANVNLNFNFIGGQDLEGPIERLQNAVTANYYANASVYDDKADVKHGGIYDPSVNINNNENNNNE